MNANLFLGLVVIVIISHIFFIVKEIVNSIKQKRVTKYLVIHLLGFVALIVMAISVTIQMITLLT